MDSLPAFAHLHLRFVDHVQWRYELMRPVVLLDNRTAPQRAAEPQTPPATVRHLARRVRQQDPLGLFPEPTEISPPSRGKPVPDGSSPAIFSDPSENAGIRLFPVL
jgi:hypothetical protein